MEKIDKGLATKYDHLYSGDAVIDQPIASASPIKGWPIDRYQMLTFLAHHTKHIDHSPKRLLEIGCGRGNVLASLTNNYDELVGTELSTVRSESARQRLAHLENCRILNVSIDNLVEMDLEPFDCIIWACVIAHTVDVIETMHLLAKLSRAGTKLITITPNIAYLPQRLRLLWGRFPNASQPNHNNHGFASNYTDTTLFDGGHLHYFTYQQVELLYQVAGFLPEQRFGFGRRFSKVRNWWPTLLSGSICISGSFFGSISSD